MADSDASQGEKRFVNIRTPFPANAQSAKLVQPTQRAFHHPAIDTQAAAMRGEAVAQDGDDSPRRQGPAMRCGVVPPIPLHAVQSEARVTRWPAIGGIAPTKGNRCVTSLRLAPVRIAASGMPFTSVMTWCFEPFFPRSVRLGPTFAPPQNRPHGGAVHDRPREVDLVGPAQPCQQGVVDLFPHPGALPVPRQWRASTSSPIHSPSPGADPPTECLSSAQRECRSAPPDPGL